MSVRMHVHFTCTSIYNRMYANAMPMLMSVSMCKVMSVFMSSSVSASM